MKYYSYEQFRIDTNKLIEKTKVFEADAIIAIARGGMTLAHCMGEGLGVRDVKTIRTELYDHTQKRDSITVENSCNLEGLQKILVLDDIADSGDTLKAVMDDLKQKYPKIEFKTVTLFYKKTSIIEPDFWVNEADEWIEFFWEKDYSS